MRKVLLDAAFEAANELEGRAKSRAVLRIIRNARKDEKDYVLGEATKVARAFEGVDKARALVDIADNYRDRSKALTLLAEAVTVLDGSKDTSAPAEWNEVAERVFETHGRLRVEEAQAYGKDVPEDILDTATAAVQRITNSQTRANYLTMLLAINQ